LPGYRQGRVRPFYLPVLPLYGFTKFYTNPFLLIYLLLHFKLPVLILIWSLKQKNQNPCSHSVYCREGGLPSSLPMVMVVTKRVSGLVWLVLGRLVLGLHHRDSHILRSRLNGRTLKGAQVSPDMRWVLPNKGGVPTSASKGPGWPWDCHGGHGWWGGDTIKCS
jgi:hypothetical protein